MFAIMNVVQERALAVNNADAKAVTEMRVDAPHIRCDFWRPGPRFILMGSLIFLFYLEGGEQLLPANH